jgi:nucleoside-diphosphate-sugar epimerase
VRTLVTGADGFVGSALCPLFEAQGLDVRRAVWKVTNSHDPAHEWVATGDIGPDTDWHALLNGVQVVIHLANRAHIMSETASDPLREFRRVNTQGTQRLAEQAQAQGIRRFVFVSSIGIHGEVTPRGQSWTEDSPANPANDYTVSKWEAEVGLQELADRTGWDVVIVRPPLVYGPGVPGNFLRLLHLAARRLPLPFASVRNRRSFVALSNLVDFLQVCATHPAAANQTFLISDGEDVSTAQLVQKLGHCLDIPQRLFPFPLFAIEWGGRLARKSRTVHSLFGNLCVDSSKARQMLDWHPVINVDEQLAQTAAWYRKNYL